MTIFSNYRRIFPSRTYFKSDSRKLFYSKQREIIFGRNPVFSALSAPRRKCFNLYVKLPSSIYSNIHDTKGNISESDLHSSFVHALEQSDPNLLQAIELAKKKHVKMTFIPPDQNTLDTLLKGQVHQNIALETLPLYFNELASLSYFSHTDGNYQTLGYGKNDMTILKSHFRRSFPLWIALDSIIDPQVRFLYALIKCVKFLLLCICLLLTVVLL